METVLLSLSVGQYTSLITLETEGKKSVISVLNEDIDALSLPPCPAPVSAVLYDAICEAAHREKAVRQALACVKCRAYSKRGLFAKLKEKGISPCNAKYAVLAMVRYHYIKEVEQIRELFFADARKGYGPLRTKAKLEEAGYLPRDIDDVWLTLQNEGEPDYIAMEAMLTKRFSAEGLAKNKIKAKLCRLGFYLDDD